MKSIGTVISNLKRMPKYYLWLIAISPILISFIIHMIVLFYASFIKWAWFKEVPVVENQIPTVLLHQGKQNDRLQFQGLDQLDDFDADDHMSDPVPEIEYRPIIPEVEILPSPKAADELDIISVEATAMDNQWINPSTGGKPLDTGSDMLVGSFSKHIEALREGGLEVVFIFDSTASMRAYIKAVKQKISGLVAAFRKLVPTCKIGLVTYRDYDDEYVTKEHPLTHGMIPLKEFLIGINHGGGSDVREAVADGLKVAIEEMEWNEKSKKFILLIGDAPPHKEDMPEAIQLVKKFKEQMGGQLSVIDVRKPRNISIYYWELLIFPHITDPELEDYQYLTDKKQVMGDFITFAQIGGGESARLIDEEKVIKHMLLLIFGTRWEMYLDEFMKNL